MLCVYPPLTPLRAAIVMIDVTDAPGLVEAEDLLVCGVQALVLPSRDKDRHPAVRHEVLVWCEEFQTPRPVLDVFDDRRESLRGRRLELVVTPCPDNDPSPHQAAVELAKARLTSEHERQAVRQPTAAAR